MSRVVQEPGVCYEVADSHAHQGVSYVCTERGSETHKITHFLKLDLPNYIFVFNLLSSILVPVYNPLFASIS
jgi:hypothetical protein